MASSGCGEVAGLLWGGLGGAARLNRNASKSDELKGPKMTFYPYNVIIKRSVMTEKPHLCTTLCITSSLTFQKFEHYLSMPYDNSS